MLMETTTRGVKFIVIMLLRDHGTNIPSKSRMPVVSLYCLENGKGACRYAQAASRKGKFSFWNVVRLSLVQFVGVESAAADGCLCCKSHLISYSLPCRACLLLLNASSGLSMSLYQECSGAYLPCRQPKNETCEGEPFLCWETSMSVLRLLDFYHEF